MTIREIKHPITDRIPVRYVLASVFDKEGLPALVDGLLSINPEVIFYSTGGSYTALQKALGARADRNLISIERFTAVPEMEGGLVKTLTPKLHAGLLGERNNPAHQQYLAEMGGGIFFDMLVNNLYPFGTVIQEPGATFEHVRGNIDIGGPAMLRAGGKNHHSCAVVVNLNDYQSVLTSLRANGGATTLEDRFRLMQKVFEHTARYDRAIADHMARVDPAVMRAEYEGKGLII
ncbi:MAG TPA: hypothetical protein VJG90_01415 [Candidatus Nanoarchaeia archaeon]|nr:hypothetical protein [Candidatus Nanoarchaeia archaeon]